MTCVLLSAIAAGCGATPRATTTEPSVRASERAAPVRWVVDDDPLAHVPDAIAAHGAARELVPQWGHTAEVRELRWLPSGPLAVLDDLGHLALLEPSSGARLLWERPTSPGPWEEPFEFDRSGRYLRFGANVHDLSTGERRVLPVGPVGGVAAAAPDLTRVAWTAHGDDGTSRLVIAGPGADEVVESAVDMTSIWALNWSPSAQTILLADATAIELRSAIDGSLLRRIALEDGANARPIGAFRPTGGALAVLLEGSLVMLDPRSGVEIGRTTAVTPPQAWAELRWSADGARLAVVWREEESAVVTVFDAHDGSRVGEVRVPFGLPSEVALSPDGRVAAIGTSDGRVNVHEALGGAALAHIDSGRRAGSPPFTFDPRGRFLAVAGDEAIELWDLELREEIGGFYQPGAERHLSGVRGLSSSVGLLVADDDGTYLWTAGAFRSDDACPRGGTVRVDDAGVVRVIGALAVCDLTHGITVRPGWWIRGSSPEGHVVVNAADGLFVEDARTGERRATLALDEGERPPCTTSACGLPVAVSDEGGLVAVARRTLLRIFDGRSGAVRVRADVGARTQLLRFAPGGRSLVFVGDDGQLVVFDAATLSRRMERATGGPFAEAFSEDGSVHVHATQTTLTVLRLRGRARAAIDVALPDARQPLEVTFLGGGDYFALVRDATEDSAARILEVRRVSDGGLVGSFEADATGLEVGGPTIAWCASGVLSVLTLSDLTLSVPASVDASGARAIGTCATQSELDVTRDGGFVYVADTDGLHVVRASDGARLSLHVVDAGWGVTAAIVADDSSRWDDGGYFESPFLLRAEGAITTASLDDARSSYVAGLAAYFTRGESPPADEVAQSSDTAPDAR